MAEHMLDNEEFDVVVLGTGLIESIVASDIAAAGKKVLHIDKNPYYGGDFSCFSLSAFLEWAMAHRDSRQVPLVDITVGSGDSRLRFLVGEQVDKDTAESRKQDLGGRISSASENDKRHKRAVELLLRISPYMVLDDNDDAAIPGVLETLSSLADMDRKYSIELAPKLAFCRGTLIDLLIDVGIGEYVEFKGVEHNYLVRDGQIERVPESKEEVFASKSLKLIDKRKLMKLLTSMSDDEECAQFVADNADDDFRSFLQSRFRLDGALLDAVLYCVARAKSESELSVREGCERIQRYTRSIGRYGRMAYLCSMYGGGSELAQSFSRLCAVSGGTYILGESVRSIQRSEDKYSMELSHGEVSAKHIIMNTTYAPDAQPSNGATPVSRSFCVVDKPVLGEDTTALLSYIGKTGVVSLLYLTQSTMAVPRGQCIIYAWADGALADKRELLAEAMETVCSKCDGAAVLLSVFFETRSLSAPSSDSSPSISYTAAPDSSVDFDTTVQHAQAILDAYFSE
ncbi:FAD/NAD(P)-binding domain-containing protein [Martensiomyces pterosporus]|nr:FAD/NAD(P)-binding domain-containing protein [Martensiomyces pterosporus]